MLASRKPVTCEQIMARFPQFFVEIVGDKSTAVQAVSSPDSATSTDLVFLATPKALSTGLASNAAALVVGKKSRAEAETHANGRTLLIATNVELAMANVISEFFLKTPYTNSAVQGVHPAAHVHSSAVLGKDVRIGPGAFIGANVKIGDGTYVGTNAVIEDFTEIGNATVIHPLVFIGHSTLIGNRCEIHPSAVVGKEGYGYSHDERFNHTRIPHQGRVVIEDDVHLGACCTIDRATFGETRIEAGAKFDNRVHIGHNSSVGRNSLFTAGCVVAGSTKVGANVVVGGLSAITGHISICDNVQLAGFSAVTKTLDKPGQYGGNPLLPLQQHIKMKVSLSHLTEMRATVKRIAKHLGLDSADSDQ